MKTRLTKRTVEALAPDPARRLLLYDADLPGFGVTVFPTGRKTFFAEYGARDGRRRMALGAFGVLTVEQARELARAKLAEVVMGGDPLRERRALAAVPTFGAWAESYLEGVRLRKKQPRHDERYLRLAAGRWGTRRLGELGRADVEAAVRKEAERGATSANRFLASVRACLAAAVRDGHIPANPTAGIRPFRENPPRDRVLSDDELGRVVAALDTLPAAARLALSLLLETGARKSEVLRARWADLDLDGGTWRIPSPKAGRPQVVPLAPGTVARLRLAPRDGAFVVAGADPSRPRADLRRAWDTVRAAAALDGVTVHDLRRTFGLAAAREVNIWYASKLLRHSDVRVTERVYAPLGLDDLRAATATVERDREARVLAFRGRTGGGG